MSDLRTEATRILAARRCTAVGWNGPIPIIDFGEATLAIYYAWRGDGPDWGVGSGDEASSEHPLTPLVDRQVISVESIGPWHDLAIRFDDARTLSLFGDSGQHESWQLTSSEGLWLIGGPGALWSMFEPGSAAEAADDVVQDR